MGRAFPPDHLLTQPLMATLGTVDAEGCPRTAPVWYAWEAGALWIPSHAAASSARRIATRPDVSVEIVDFDRRAGRLLHLGLRGRAEIQAMDAGLFRRLLTRYLGPEEGWNPWFVSEVARIDDPDGRLIRLVPVSTFTNNVSHFRSGPEYAWPPDQGRS